MNRAALFFSVTIIFVSFLSRNLPISAENVRYSLDQQSA